jgi:hypothetical protein
VDLASLLLAALRASGVPAYYARGYGLVDGADAASWVGVTDTLTAANLLATAGYDVGYIAAGGREFVEVLHTWVEACFLFNDVTVRAQLDPSFKLHTLEPGRNVAAEAGLSGENLMTTLLDASTANPAAASLSINDLPLELADQLRADRLATMLDHLEDNHPTLTTEQIVGRKTIVAENPLVPPVVPPVLRSSLPVRLASLSAADRQHIRFQVAGLDKTLSLPELAGRRVNLTFVPATTTDAAQITANGGILKTTPRSVNLKPRLSIDGTEVALGSAAALGDFYPFALDFYRGATQFTDRVLHTVTVGGVFAVALDTQRVSASSVEAANQRLQAAIANGESALDEDVVGELLHALGRLYFGYQDRLFEYGAGTQGAVLFHQVNEALVAQDLYAARAGNPTKMFLSSKTIDAPRTIVSAFKSDGTAMDLLPLLYTAGVGSSSFEDGIFRLGIGWPAISTTQFFQEAAENEVKIFGIGPENVNAILPQLQVSTSIKNNIAQLVAAGYRALVPQRQLRILDWQGLGWIVYDPDNGTGGFLISGGLAGGSGLLSYEGATAEEMADGIEEEADFLDGYWAGLIKGDFDGSNYSSPAYLAGKIVGQIISGVLIYGDVRDGVAAIGTIVESRGSSGWLDLGLSVVGLVPVVGDAIKSAKYGDEAVQIARAFLGNGDAGLTTLRNVTSKEVADSIVVNLGKNSTVGDVVATTIRGSDAAVTAVTKNGTQGTHIVLENGDGVLRSLGLDPTVGSAANRGLIGETVARDIAAQRGWTRLDTKANPTTPGLDGVFRDTNGNIVIVEAKFIEGGHNVGLSRLRTTVGGNPQTELTDDWIFGTTPNGGAIDRSLAEETIDQQVYDEIQAAMLNGTLRKELVVVSNTQSGRTITETLATDAELGGAGGIKFTIVEMNKVVARP